MTYEQLANLANETFKTHPSVRVLYGTTDGQFFFEREHAAAHGRSIQSHVTPYNRPAEVVEVPQEYDKEAERKDLLSTFITLARLAICAGDNPGAAEMIGKAVVCLAEGEENEELDFIIQVLDFLVEYEKEVQKLTTEVGYLKNLEIELETLKSNPAPVALISTPGTEPEEKPDVPEGVKEVVIEAFNYAPGEKEALQQNTLLKAPAEDAPKKTAKTPKKQAVKPSAKPKK